MTVKTLTLQLNTHGNGETHDLTERLAEALASTGIQNGTLTLFCPSSTSALTTIEYESGCVSDLRQLFEEILPSNREYAHNARCGDGNGHSHIRASLLGASLTIPFIQQRLTLGTWQQIIYVDFDVRPRQREIIVQVMGE